MPDVPRIARRSTRRPGTAPIGVSAWPALVPALVLALVLATPAQAADHDGHEHDHGQHQADDGAAADGYRALGAHVHGEATLNVAQDGESLLLELDSPLMNLIGFEHPPRDDAERAAVAAAEATLGDAARLFAPDPAAGCTLASAEVRLTLADADDGHDHEAGHEHAADHDHDHDTDGEHEHHADAHAEYAFRCASPDALGELRVGLFAAFPGTVRLRVQVAGPDGQRAVELTAVDPRVPL